MDKIMCPSIKEHPMLNLKTFIIDESVIKNP
jgi:hypothetical protein